MEQGHHDVRYRRPGERTSVGPTKKPATKRPAKDTPFPPTVAAMKAKKLNEQRGSDALDRRLPGSFESVSGGKGGDDVSRWWLEDPQERYWVETLSERRPTL
jgi:hypothetical protein